MNTHDNEFVLYSQDQKLRVCEAVAADLALTETTDYCGYITVSTYQTYNQYYQGLQEQLATWQISLEKNYLLGLEDEVSESVSLSVSSMVDNLFSASQP